MLPATTSDSAESFWREASPAGRGYVSHCGIVEALAPDQRGRAALPLGSRAPSTEERRSHGEEAQKKAVD